MRAIKAMKSRDEFKLACQTHIDTKLQLRVKKAKIKKEILKLQRALNSMLKTQQTIALELEKTKNVRQQIQTSEYYVPKTSKEAPDVGPKTKPSSAATSSTEVISLKPKQKTNTINTSIKNVTSKTLYI